MVLFFRTGGSPYLRYPIPKSLPSGKGLFDFLTPVSCVTSPFRVASDKETAQWAFSASSLLCRIGYTDHSLWSGRAAPLLQLSAKVLLTRMPRR